MRSLGLAFDGECHVIGFTVFRTTATAPLSELQYDHAGNVVSWNCPEDYGVNGPDPARGRDVTLTVAGQGRQACLVYCDCSCQFGKSWGVHLCRHVQHCMTVMQVQCVETLFCHIPKWEKRFDVAAMIEENERRRTSGVETVGVGGTFGGTAGGSRTTAAVLAPPPLYQQTAARVSTRLAGSVAEQWGTVVNRKAHLIEVHTAVLALGCHSDLLCHHVSDALSALRTSAHELVERAQATATDAAASRAAASSRAAAPAAELSHGGEQSNQPHFDWLPQATKTAILKVMGNDFVLDSSAPLGGPSTGGKPHLVLGRDGSDRSQLIGRHIVCNWPKTNGSGQALDDDQSGWCIGEVVASTAVEFSVNYGVEDTQEQLLAEASCLNFSPAGAAAGRRGMRAKSYDWFLLRGRGLHNLPSGTASPRRPAAPHALEGAGGLVWKHERHPLLARRHNSQSRQSSRQGSRRQRRHQSRRPIRQLRRRRQSREDVEKTQNGLNKCTEQTENTAVER